MKSVPLALISSLLFTMLLPRGAAQTVPLESTPPPATPVKTADEEWMTLKDLGGPKLRPKPSSSDPAAVKQARELWVAGLVGDADELKEFQTKNPGHPSAKEAKRLEALLLVRAWHAGDTANGVRRDKLVGEVRTDATISPDLRIEIAAGVDNFGIARRTDLSRADRLAAFEQAARGLVAEFPELPSVYEALFQVAKYRPDDRAQSIAAEVLEAPATPRWVKQEARTMLARFALVGRSLAEVMWPLEKTPQVFKQPPERGLVIYSWIAQSRASLALAKEIAAKAPAGWTIVGINLDTNVAAAKEAAGSASLPGEQIYDEDGRLGIVAIRTRLTSAGCVYLIDSQGIIRSVTAQHDLSGAFAQTAAE